MNVILPVVFIHESDNFVFIYEFFQDLCFLWVWPQLIIYENITIAVVYKYDLGKFAFVNMSM
jgi:hypothetical protein